MLNRWTIPMLLAGLFVGYAFTGRTVEAQQPELVPFSIGETVTFGLAQDAAQRSFGDSIECTITARRGAYVKCGPRTLSGGLTQTEQWLSIEYVVQITNANAEARQGGPRRAS